MGQPYYEDFMLPGTRYDQPVSGVAVKTKDPKRGCSIIAGHKNGGLVGISAHFIVANPIATVTHSLGISARRRAAARHYNFQLCDNFFLHVDGGLVRRHLNGGINKDCR